MPHQMPQKGPLPPMQTDGHPAFSTDPAWVIALIRLKYVTLMPEGDTIAASQSPLGLDGAEFHQTLWNGPAAC